MTLVDILRIIFVIISQIKRQSENSKVNVRELSNESSLVSDPKCIRSQMAIARMFIFWGFQLNAMRRIESRNHELYNLVVLTKFRLALTMTKSSRGWNNIIRIWTLSYFIRKIRGILNVDLDVYLIDM